MSEEQLSGNNNTSDQGDSNNNTSKSSKNKNDRPNQSFPKKGKRKGPVHKRVHKTENIEEEEREQKEKLKKDENDDDKSDTISSTVQKTEDKTDENGGDEEVEICLVCAEDIRYAATYPCNHFVCHVCSLRLRALMKTNNCPMCRTDQPTVIVSDNTDRRYEEYAQHELLYKDDKIGMYFDSQTTRDEVQSLLKFNCPAKHCSNVASGWKDLKNHVHNTHDKVLCDICTRHKKAFPLELDLFTRRSLLNHQRNGDNKGFTGHPECEFCHVRYYSGDELFMHCREKHEKCFLCERQNPQNVQYYRDYDALEKHFREKHYACNVRMCLDQKFVVFGTEVELQEHMLSTHPEIMGKSRAARRIEPTFNSTRDRNNNNNDAGGFRSQLSTFDPSSLPTQAEANSSNSNSNNNNNKRNTQANGTASAVAAAPSTNRAGNFEEAFPALGAARASSGNAASGSSSSNNSNSSANRPQLASVARFHSQTPPVDNSREVIERRLEERARLYLGYDMAKFEKFKEINQKFKSDSVNASVLIFEYNRIFDNIDLEKLELLVNDNAKLLKPGKSKTLVQEFSEWKKKQKNFPSLGGNNSSSSSSTSSVKGTVGVSSTWASNNSGGKAKALSKDPKDSFPSLPTKPNRNSNTPPTPSSSNNNKPSVSDVASGVKKVNVSKAPALKKNEFPSLPTSSQKKPPPVRPQAVHNPQNWGKKPAATQDEESVEYQDDDFSESSSSSKKGNKGKKKVLYHYGF